MAEMAGILLAMETMATVVAVEVVSRGDVRFLAEGTGTGRFIGVVKWGRLRSKSTRFPTLR